MPEGFNQSFFRGEFSATAALTSSIASMELPNQTGVMALARLSEFMSRCQWGPHSIDVLLMSSIGSLTYYPLNMVTREN